MAIKKLGIKITDNIKDVISNTKKAEVELEKLQQKKVDIQVQLDKKNNLKNQMRAIQAEITKINSQKLDIKVSTNKAKDTINQINKQLEDKRASIKVQTDSNEVHRLVKEIQDLERKKIKLNVDVTEGAESIKRLNQQADELRSKKASIKVQADGIEETQRSLNAVDRQIRDINGRRVKIDLFSAGQSISAGLGYLSDFSNTLSKMSFAPLEAGARAALDVVQQLAGVAKGLFNELEGDINMEKVFRQNQALLNVNAKETNAVYKELDKYADRTVYNSAEMLNTYNALFNSGTKGTTELVKGLGAIAATAADSKQAMSTLSLQFSQAMINGLQRTDLRFMAEATNGGLAVAFKQAGKDFEDFSRRLGVANEKSDPGIRTRLANELEEVVRAAANNPEMNKLAETPKEISQGWEVVTDSLINVTRKGFMPLQNVGIKWLMKLADQIEGLKNSKGLQEFGDEIADFADKKLAKLYEFAKNTDFKKVWSEFSSGFTDSLDDLKKYLAPYKALFKSFFHIDTSEMDIYDVSRKLGEIIPKLLEWGIKFKTASLVFKGASAGFDVFSKIYRYANVKLPTGGLFSKLFSGGKSAQTITAPKVNTGAFKTFAKGLGVIAGLSGTILIGAKALQEIDKVKIGNHLPSKLRNLGLAVTAMGVFAGAVGFISTKVPLVGGAVVLGTKMIAGISAVLWETGKAMQEIDKIKVKGNYTKKIKAVGEVLTAMSGVGGKLLAENSNMANLDIWVNTKLQAGQLKSYAKMVDSLNEIAKMPDIKTEEIRAKLRAVKESLSVLDEGEFVDVPIVSNIVSFFESIRGITEMVKDGANAASLKAFVDMSRSLEELGGDFDPDTEKIKANIQKIKSVVDVINFEDDPDAMDIAAKMATGETAGLIKLANGLIDFGGAIKEKLEALEKEFNADKIKSLTSMVGSLKTLESTKLSVKKIRKSLKSVKSAIEEINESDIADLDLELDQDKKGNIKGFLSGDNTKAIGNLKKSVENLKSVMDNINSLGGSINIANIRTNIPLISEVISLLNQNIQKGDSENMMSTKGFEGVDTRIKSLKSIMENINSLAAYIDKSSIDSNIAHLKNIYANIKEAFPKGMSNETMSVEGYGGMKSRFESLKGIIEIINSLAAYIDKGAIDSNLDHLKAIYEKIIGAFPKGMSGETMEPEGFRGMKSRIVTLKEIADNLNGLAIEIDFQRIKDNITGIGDRYSEIVGKFGKDTDIAKNIDPEIFTNLLSAITSLSGVATNMRDNLSAEMPFLAEGGTVETNINGIYRILGKIKEYLRDVQSIAENSDNFQNASTAISEFAKIPPVLNGLEQYAGIDERINPIIDAVDSVLQNINDLPTPIGIEQMNELVQGFRDLVGVLNSLQDQFKPVGEGYGRQVIEGFKSVDFETPASEKVHRLLNKLLSMLPSFREAGRQAGNAYSDGLTSQLDTVNVSAISSKLGGQLKKGILDSLNGIGKDIEDAINLASITSNVTSALNAITNTGRARNRSDGRFWEGGLIGNSLSFAGHDTKIIEASQGEYMIPRKSVRHYGVDILDRIRNMTFKMPEMPAMPTILSSSISNTSNTDDHSTVTQIIKIEGKSDAMARLKASKYSRGLKK